MYSFSKDQAVAAIFALTGCTAVFLVPGEASAFQRGFRPSAMHAVAARPRVTLRPSFQPRRTVQFHNQAAVRHPSFNMSRPVRMAGVGHHPSFGAHTQSPGSFGARFTHPMTGASHLPHVMAGGTSHRVSFLPGPHTIGSGFPHQQNNTNLGGHLASHFPGTNGLGLHPHVPATGSGFNGLGNHGTAGSQSAATLLASLPRPNSIGATDKHPRIVCFRAPCPTHLPTGQAGGNQKPNKGADGTGTATKHPPIECFRAPCPTHLPTGQGNNTQAQDDGGNKRGPDRRPRFPGRQPDSDNTPVSQPASSGDVGTVANPVSDPAPVQQVSAPSTTSSSPVQMASYRTGTTQAAAQPSVPTTPTPAPAATNAAPQSVYVIFQQNLSATDMAAFLQAYKATIAEGPSADGVYRLQIDPSFDSSQMQELVDSMKGQDNIVTNVSLN